MDLKPNSIRKYCSVAQYLKEGQNQAYMRVEDQNNPANQVAIPDEVPVFTAEQKGKKAGDYDRFVAFLEKDGQRVVIESEKTRAKLEKSISWAMCFSSFAPSAWYRTYRQLFGFSFDSTPYQSATQKKEAERRSMGMLFAFMGVQDPSKAAKAFVG